MYKARITDYVMVLDRVAFDRPAGPFFQRPLGGDVVFGATGPYHLGQCVGTFGPKI